jgi:hypothetical protein
MNEMLSHTFRNPGCDALPAQLDTLLDLKKEVRSLSFQVFVGTGEDVFYTRPSLRARADGDLSGEGFVTEIVAIHARHIGEFLHRDVVRFHTQRGVITWEWGRRGVL